MGEPSSGHAELPAMQEETQGTETSKYLWKRNQIRDSLSSGERTGNSLNLFGVIGTNRCQRGVVGPIF